MSNYVLDMKNVNSRDDFHNLVAREMDFPSYYGKNLDALWDLLTEENGVSVLIMNANKLEENLGDYGKSILRLFSEFGQIEGNKVDFIYSGCHIEDENFSVKNKEMYTIKSLNNKSPKLSDSAIILDGARVTGDVILEENVSVWYNATIRADYNNIYIGRNSNVQDNAVIHLSHDSNTFIGENVTIGHSAIVHGATINDNVIVGMGSIILDNAIIGKNSIVGAGALVTMNKEFPENSLIVGSPAKVVRQLTNDEIKSITDNARNYVENSKKQF